MLAYFMRVYEQRSGCMPVLPQLFAFSHQAKSGHMTFIHSRSDLGLFLSG